MGLRASSVYLADGRRHVLHPEHAYRGHQSRAGHHVHADRQPGHGKAVPRVMGFVWSGIAQRQLADLRRARCPTDEYRAVAGDLRPALVVGLSFGRARRGVVPKRRRPDLVHQQPGGCATAGAPGYARRAQGLERDELPAGGRSRDPHSHRAIRAGLPDASQRARAYERVERAGVHVRSVRRRSPEARDVCSQLRCSPGG